MKKWKDKTKKTKTQKKRRRQKDKKTKTKKRIWYCDVRAVSHSCDVFVHYWSKYRMGENNPISKGIALTPPKTVRSPLCVFFFEHVQSPAEAYNHKVFPLEGKAYSPPHSEVSGENPPECWTTLTLFSWKWRENVNGLDLPEEQLAGLPSWGRCQGCCLYPLQVISASDFYFLSFAGDQYFRFSSLSFAGD